MIIPELAFLEQRAAEEAALALRTQNLWVAGLHRQIATLYRERADRLRIGGEQPSGQPRAA